jgi:hypothetical protein
VKEGEDIMAMSDDEFTKLKIRAGICPESLNWPTGFSHWDALHACAETARSAVAKVYAACDAVDKDANLSESGKAKRRAEIAEKAVADLQKSSVLENAKRAVQRQQEYWRTRVEDAIPKPADTVASAMTAAEIRAHLAAMKEGRLAFVLQHLDDSDVIAAILTGPSFLSGLTPTEIGVVKGKLEARVFPAEVLEAKANTEQALAGAERGWQRAGEIICQRGGLPKAAPVKTKAA